MLRVILIFSRNNGFEGYLQILTGCGIGFGTVDQDVLVLLFKNNKFYFIC